MVPLLKKFSLRVYDKIRDFQKVLFIDLPQPPRGPIKRTFWKSHLGASFLPAGWASLRPALNDRLLDFGVGAWLAASPPTKPPPSTFSPSPCHSDRREESITI